MFLCSLYSYLPVILNNTFIVSSNSNTEGLSEEAFHVKREKFLINNDEYRFIDVITVKWRQFP